MKVAMAAMVLTRLPIHGARMALSKENVMSNSQFNAANFNTELQQWLHAPYKSPQNNESFLLVVHNVMADANARTHCTNLYSHIPALITDWDAHKANLLLDLRLWALDIMCLQKVDRFDEFNEELQRDGYVGVYKRQTGASRDGCAVFWKENRFVLVEEVSIEFKEHNL